MTDRDVSLSYFVLPGKLYLLVGPRPCTRTYSHRQKCWKARLLLLTSFFPFLPLPAPGPMSRKSLTFVRVIVLGYLAKEETLFFWGLKWTKLSCVQPSQLLLSGIVALAFKIALVPVGCRWMRKRARSTIQITTPKKRSFHNHSHLSSVLLQFSHSFQLVEKSVQWTLAALPAFSSSGLLTRTIPECTWDHNVSVMFGKVRFKEGIFGSDFKFPYIYLFHILIKFETLPYCYSTK